MIYRKTQVINAPVEKVFKTVVEIQNFPKWNTTTPVTKRIGNGKIGQGSEFEMKVRGFGMVRQTLDEFKLNRQVMIVPHIKMLGGGHRFIFKKLSNNKTEIKHEMVMIPKGFFKIFSPMMKMMGEKNVNALASSLQKYLES